MVRIQGGRIDYESMPGSSYDPSTGGYTVSLSSPVPISSLTPNVYVSTVIARPQGGIHVKGAILTGAAYATVCERLVALNKQFQLSKTIVSSKEDVYYKLVWGTDDKSIEVYVPAKTPLPDWYPWNYETIVGDGVKTFKVQAKTPSGGTNATCQAEIVGEEA